MKGGISKPISAGDSLSIGGRLQQKMSCDALRVSTAATQSLTRQTSIDVRQRKSLNEQQIDVKLRKNSSQNSAELSQEQQDKLDKDQKNSKVYYSSMIRMQVQQEQGKEQVKLNQEGDQKSYQKQPKNSVQVSQKQISTISTTQAIEKIQSEFTTQGSEGFSLNFILKKDGAQIRQNYLKKLVYNKIWLLPQNKPKSHQTVIIFDWDDTLLCTSHLNPSGYLQDLLLPRPLTNQLKNLDKASTNILKLALQNGKVIIITNAAPGWVQFSAKKYLPEVFSILDKIQIISARGEYQAKYPGNCHQWKMLAFLQTQKQLDTGAITNLLALGDSNIEMDAAHHLATKFQKALIKTVKFRQSPSPQELVKQLNLVHQKFNQICHSVRNLTIRLQRKSSRPTNNNNQQSGGPSIDGPAPPPGAVPALH